MKIMGLDPSLTGYGLATRLEGGTIPVVRRIAPRIRGHERLELLMTEVARECKGADLAVVEGLAFGAQGDTLLDLAGLSWMTRHLLWRLGVPYAVIPPSNLKQFATGGGKADKVAMALAADRRFPQAGVSDADTADALWACVAGCQYAGEPVGFLPAGQIAVLTAVHTTKSKWGKPKIIWPEVLGNCGPRPEPETGVLFTRDAV